MRPTFTILIIVLDLTLVMHVAAQTVNSQTTLASASNQPDNTSDTQAPTSAPTALSAATAATPPTMTKPWYEIAAMFAWPAVALFALLLFRAQLAELLSAISRHMQKARVKMLGVELEIAHVQNTEQFKAYSKNIGEKPEISGDPNKFQLLCKASNSRLAKSTKVLNLSNGCLVQVSTREVMDDHSIAVAEALAFVPDLNVKLDKTYEERKPEQDEKVTAAFISTASNVA
jgi:hypothetical protein